MELHADTLKASQATTHQPRTEREARGQAAGLHGNGPGLDDPNRANPAARFGFHRNPAAPSPSQKKGAAVFNKLKLAVLVLGVVFLALGVADGNVINGFPCPTNC